MRYASDLPTEHPEPSTTQSAAIAPSGRVTTPIGVLAAAAFALTLLTGACTGASQPDGTSPHGSSTDSSVELLTWTEQMAVRDQWLTKRHDMLLPMMRLHGIDMWIVVNEEFHDDPLTEYIAPARPYTGRRTSSSSSMQGTLDSGRWRRRAIGKRRWRASSSRPSIRTLRTRYYDLSGKSIAPRRSASALADGEE